MNSHDPFGLLAFLHWNNAWNGWHFDDATLNRALDQIQDLGVSFVRMDLLWSDIDAGPRRYQFEKYDRLVALTREHGLSLLGVLQYNKVERENGTETWNRPPDSFDEFAAYVGATVSRYKDRISHWEIWNEPNLSVYWSKPKDNLKSYADLLKKSYVAAKKADPSCIILNGGLTEPVVEDVGHLYSQGAKKFFDVLNIHTFVDPADPASEARFDAIIHGTEQVSNQHGDGAKKIWITEMGCPGAPAEYCPCAETTCASLQR
jgi:hypothetical protein